ncbi:MAG: hypothetical protein COA74_06960 [Gammaproteobacteria bacterium]|nr:MAG: hypothetical protein COA74_06960 [Gammaproteobacteria bacterium]
MNPLPKIILFAILACVTSSCYSKPVIFNDVKDLNFVNNHLAKNTNPEDKVLVIFDIDDTLLEAVNFVGSNKWYNWQRGKEVFDPDGTKISISDHEVFYCMFSTLGTLFDLGTSKLTQPDAAQLILDLDGHDLMLLTSRTYSFRRATERELKINGFDFSSKHLLNNGQTLEFDFYDNSRTDRVTYQRGLVMVSGLNKGLVLRVILAKIAKQYDAIYFVDDSHINIVQMQAEWKDDPTRFNIFHYTRIDRAISKEEIAQSNQAKKIFDDFLKTAYPDRFETFASNKCR